MRRPKRVRATKADPIAARHPDLDIRDFTATAPNQLWVTDLTCVPTWTGVAYVCFIVDAYSRLIVSWRVAPHMRTDMVLDAIGMARWSRGASLDGLRCHSAAGSQFTSIRYGERLAEIGAVPSIGTIADSYDQGRRLKRPESAFAQLITASDVADRGHYELDAGQRQSEPEQRLVRHLLLRSSRRARRMASTSAAQLQCRTNRTFPSLGVWGSARPKTAGRPLEWHLVVNNEVQEPGQALRRPESDDVLKQIVEYGSKRRLLLVLPGHIQHGSDFFN